MALKICQFKFDYNLSAIPASRAYSFSGGTVSFNVLPNGENKLVKKIVLDCVYNSPGDLLISDYYFSIQLLNFNNIPINSDHIVIINGDQNVLNIATKRAYLNKKNSLIKINEIIGGFNIVNAGLVLSNTTSPIVSNVSFFITLYYV